MYWNEMGPHHSVSIANILEQNRTHCLVSIANILEQNRTHCLVSIANILERNGPHHSVSIANILEQNRTHCLASIANILEQNRTHCLVSIANILEQNRIHCLVSLVWVCFSAKITADWKILLRGRSALSFGTASATNICVCGDRQLITMLSSKKNTQYKQWIHFPNLWEREKLRITRCTNKSSTKNHIHKKKREEKKEGTLHTVHRVLRWTRPWEKQWPHQYRLHTFHSRGGGTGSKNLSFTQCRTKGLYLTHSAGSKNCVSHSARSKDCVSHSAGSKDSLSHSAGSKDCLSQWRIQGLCLSQSQCRIQGLSLTQCRIQGLCLSEWRIQGLCLSQSQCRIQGLSLTVKDPRTVSLTQCRIQGLCLSQWRIQGLCLTHSAGFKNWISHSVQTVNWHDEQGGEKSSQYRVHTLHSTWGGIGFNFSKQSTDTSKAIRETTCLESLSHCKNSPVTRGAMWGEKQSGQTAHLAQQRRKNGILFQRLSLSRGANSPLTWTTRREKRSVQSAHLSQQRRRYGVQGLLSLSHFQPLTQWTICLPLGLRGIQSLPTKSLYIVQTKAARSTETIEKMLRLSKPDLFVPSHTKMG